MAEWKKITPAGIYECTECGQTVMTMDIAVYRFCHGCGALMREYQEYVIPATCASCENLRPGNTLMYRCALVENSEFEFIGNSRRIFCPFDVDPTAYNREIAEGIKPVLDAGDGELALEDYPDEDDDTGYDPFIGSRMDEI